MHVPPLSTPLVRALSLAPALGASEMQLLQYMLCAMPMRAHQKTLIHDLARHGGGVLPASRVSSPCANRGMLNYQPGSHRKVRIAECDASGCCMRKRRENRETGRAEVLIGF